MSTEDQRNEARRRALHKQIACELCTQNTHSYFVVTLGTQDFKICKSCKEYIDNKKTTLPRYDFAYNVTVIVEAVSQEDADTKFQRHMEKYFGRSIGVSFTMSKDD